MHYHPMIRSAILTSMFGYGLAGFSVMVDVGRPWNAYNFFIPSKWQANSAMFEVALCVMAYTNVLLLEFLPAVLTTLEKRVEDAPVMDVLHHAPASSARAYGRAAERSRAGLAGRARQVIFILGLLPTMHQSSLGSAADRLDQAAPALAHRLPAAVVPDQLHVYRLLDCDPGVGHLLLRLQAPLRDQGAVRHGPHHPLADGDLAVRCGG
jgi:hypothetical protein